MTQPTIVIGVESAEISTLAMELPNAWRNDDTNVRYIAISATTRDAIAWKWVDVNIAEGKSDDTLSPGVRITKGPVVTDVLTTRHSKYAQAEFINRIFSNKEYWPEFLPLQAWKNAKDYDGDCKTPLIIRPNNGARGIGQLTFDPSVTSLASLDKAVYWIDKMPLEVPTPSAGDTKNDNEPGDIVEVSSDRNKIDKLNARLRKAFADVPGNPQWYSDGDRTKGEGYSVFKQDRFIQEYATDIEFEYRIIIGGDNTPVYALLRKRTPYGQLGNIELKSASGEDVGLEKSFTDLNEARLPHYVIQGFKRLCQHSDFSLFSFDVFITSSGKWGILEFSNEFGQCSVPNGLVNREIKKFIERVTAP